MKKFKTSSGGDCEYEEVKEADGIEGFLIHSMGVGMRFRVYDKVNLDRHGCWTFHDYSITHSDLHVKIIGDGAFYHTSDGKVYLDHSPETLGMKEIE